MSASGFSTDRLGRIHDIMAGYVERGTTPGLVTLVSRRGEVHVDVIGKKTIEGNDPIQRDTIFRITSMTKPITAVAAMILVEECKLRLDEPVDDLLPELANRKVLVRLDGPISETVPAIRPITVRDVMTFTMGFGLLFGPRAMYPIVDAMIELSLSQGMPGLEETPAPDEWIRRLGTLPLMHQPGEKWMYNTGSDVLGVLIARASGQPFETFLRERIFEPLGMKDTAFSVPEKKIDRFVPSYLSNFETGELEVYDQAAGGRWSRPPAFPSGGAGLVSTIDDYFAFGQMMLNLGQSGSERILSRPSVEFMITDHLTPAQKAVSGMVPDFFDSHGWGFGVTIITRNDQVAESIGSYGWDGGFGTSWRNDPREDLVTLLFNQRAWDSPSPPNYCLDFWTSVYQAIDA